MMASLGLDFVSRQSQLNHHLRHVIAYMGLATLMVHHAHAIRDGLQIQEIRLVVQVVRMGTLTMGMENVEFVLLVATRVLVLQEHVQVVIMASCKTLVIHLSVLYPLLLLHVPLANSIMGQHVPRMSELDFLLLDLDLHINTLCVIVVLRFVRRVKGRYHRIV